MLRQLFNLAVLAAAGFLVWSTLLRPPEEPRSRGTPRVREREVVRPPSDHERSVKRALEAELRGQASSDQVIRTDGRVLEGRIVAESETSIRLLRSFGPTGQMETTVPRSEVREIRSSSREPPSISFRDVRFTLEFPGLNFYRRPPFTIVSDRDFFRVEEAVSVLEELHVEFTRTFGDLLVRPERDDGIQLLFFSDARQFDEYRRRYGPDLPAAAGFYSFAKDRLVLFDQKSAQWAREASAQVNVATAVQRGRVADRELDRWQHSARRSIRAETRRANRSVLRHEGAHQLFFTYGVHSEHGAEHLWLVEGLAGFCEDGLGGSRGERADDARRLGRRSTFAELVNAADRESFATLATDLPYDPWVAQNLGSVAAAYAQSWFTVQHLMRKHRDGFFEYIRFVRDAANLEELDRVPRFELLARFIGLRPEALESELQREHARL